MSVKNRLCCVILAVVMLFFGFVPAASAVSTGSAYLLIYLGEKKAYVNEEEITLEYPPVIIDGKTYIHSASIAEVFGFDVKWNPETNKVELTSPTFTGEVDLKEKTILFNGAILPMEPIAKVVDNRLMFQFTWVADLMKVKYTYNAELHRIEALFVKIPQGLYDEKLENSRPVAKFTLDKSVYRIGEPVKYTNLSYDPDADGIAKYHWVNKRDAFFQPGRYAITLVVTDSKGNVSNPFTKWITVTDEVFMDELQYNLYFKPVGGYIPVDWKILNEHFLHLPQLEKQVTTDDSRTLIVSDSPETIKETGLLYQEKVNGKARLYVCHVNGMQEKIQFAVLVTNPGNKTVTVTTTNRGEVYPSIYANLIGHQASVDFLLNDKNPKSMEVPPGETRVYVLMPNFYPGQGVNAIYDVETTGEVLFSFTATLPKTELDSIDDLKPLAFNGHVRGTFPVSSVKWEADASSLTQPARLTIGDGKNDPFVSGRDYLENMERTNRGNYGVVYDIQLKKPPKMAVLILARGGVFKGPFKINGEFVMVPPSGVFTAFDGLQVLARTTGNEESLNIQFTPPSGSAFPIDLIFYPLDDLSSIEQP